MHRVAIISDTHIPGRATEIPDPFLERIEAADHTIHAGDFTVPCVLDRLESLTDGRFTGVSGNMDPGNLELAPVRTRRIESVTFVVTHGTGNLNDYEERVARIVQEESGPDAIGIAGHTHEVLDTTVDGIRLLNPGSLTGAAPADRPTMMTGDIDDRTLSVTLHER